MIRAYGAEDCPTYGSCKTQSKASVTQLVRSLIDAGYLRVEGQDYPTLALTGSGQEVLQGSRSLRLEKSTKRTTEASSTKPLRERIMPVPISKVEVVDPQLLERLRRLRTELAEEEGVAPFVIFHDKTLRTIASHKPLTSAALLEIPGIGEIKVERYGRRLLEILSEY
jgi:ATP-dependent DNA helicase RecQ